MPFKNPEDRKANYRKRRQDPAYLEKMRKYFREYRREHYASDPEFRAKALELTKKWSKENYVKKPPRKKMTPEEQKESLSRRKKKYKAKHRERLAKERRERETKRRIEEPEYFARAERRRYLKHGTRRNFVSRARRLGLGDAIQYFTAEDWLALLREHDFKCFYCHETLTAKTRSIDHKIPLKRGGTNDRENLVPCCRRCNSRKHTQTAEEFTSGLAN